MSRSGKLQPAADYRAMQHGDHGHGTEFERVEGLVPHSRVRHALRRRPLLKLRQVETGAEVVASAVQHDHGDTVGRRREEVTEFPHGGVIDGIALGRAIQAQQRDLAINGYRQRVGQDCPRRGRLDAAHFAASPKPNSLIAFSLRISGFTSGLKPAVSKSASQRSGVISG